MSVLFKKGNCCIDNIQQIADAVQKGLQLIARASVQQGRTLLTHLRNELYIDSFHAVLALSCGLAKSQCCVSTVTVVAYYLPHAVSDKFVRNCKKRRDSILISDSAVV